MMANVNNIHIVMTHMVILILVIARIMTIIKIKQKNGE